MTSATVSAKGSRRILPAVRIPPVYYFLVIVFVVAAVYVRSLRAEQRL